MSILLAYYSAMGGPKVAISGQTLVAVSGVPANIYYQLSTDGDVDIRDQTRTLAIEQWIAPASAAPGSYECRATLNSGAISTGTTGTWLALTTNRAWQLITDGSANLTIEIRNAAGTVLSSATVTMSRSTVGP